MPKPRPCQCECRNQSPGKLSPCRAGVVNKLDPERILCDICYYEVKVVNPTRRTAICQYPPRPNIRERIRDLVK
ncbi:hypothetical protein F4810DRAFT_127976 [Camillea tinctor]|nr:hypothetical protein F4810DRAFT_127976 [Camillea tinctor]